MNETELNKGKEIYDFCGEIFPLARSLTGEWVVKTLEMINIELVKSGCPTMDILKVPTGTRVFDWTVPK